MQNHGVPVCIRCSIKAVETIGWRGFAEFAALDDDFLVLRRFDVTTVRVLLNLQDNIACLEEDLEMVDKCCSEADEPDVDNGAFRNEPRPDRALVLSALQLVLDQHRKVELVL
jgi:hypothetical protein